MDNQDSSTTFQDPMADAREEYKELIAAATELSELSLRLTHLARAYANPGTLKNFELHSKEYRRDALEKLAELIDATEDSGKGFYKKLKRIKRVKPTPEIIDNLLDHSVPYQ